MDGRRRAVAERCVYLKQTLVPVKDNSGQRWAPGVRRERRTTARKVTVTERARPLHYIHLERRRGHSGHEHSLRPAHGRAHARAHIFSALILLQWSSEKKNPWQLCQAWRSKLACLWVNSIWMLLTTESNSFEYICFLIAYIMPQGLGQVQLQCIFNKCLFCF